MDIDNNKDIEAYERKYLDIATRGIRQYLKENQNIDKKYEPDYVAIFRSMIKYKVYHLRFIRDFSVPYINNAAERQCRIVKTKKKIVV